MDSDGIDTGVIDSDDITSDDISSDIKELTVESCQMGIHVWCLMAMTSMQIAHSIPHCVTE